jgi:DNA-binding response OmpR family regulator
MNNKIDISVLNTNKQCFDLIENYVYPDAFLSGMQRSNPYESELVKPIRDDSDTPIIFLSGDNDIKNPINLFDTGIDRYRAKLFDTRILPAS